MKKIRASIKVLILCGCLIFCMTATVMAQTSIFMNTNQSQYLNAGSNIKKVAVANPEIADVTVISQTELLVVGKKPGTTTLHIWTVNGMRQEYALSIQDSDPQTGEAIARLIASPEVSVEKIGDKILLKGTVLNQLEKENAEKIAGMYATKVVNLLQMTHPDQVRLEAKIVEISTDKVKKLGIQYANASKIDKDSGIVTVGSNGIFGFGQTFVNSKDSSSRSNIGYADINATLQALITNGDAKVLSQPSMVTMSGEKANILVGGEIPIPMSNSDGQITVQWREYGIKLNIEPQVMEDEQITSKVTAEVSTLDSSSSAAINLSNGLSIPALRSRKAETVIHMSSGSTMVIGGLLSSEEGKQVTKFPFLGDLPLIGQFFRNTTTSKEKKEIIIMVTPTLVDETTAVDMSTDMKDFIKSSQEKEKPAVKKK